MELELADVSLSEILKSGLTMHEERATRGALTLGLEVLPEEIVLRADERKLRQIVFNLLSNAVKFTPEGGRVEVHVERTLGGAAIEIHDTGVGLDPGDEERVFDRFYRAPSAVSDQVPGTGLGLFIARAIAERHGGSLVARRRDGGGSIFRLELPASTTADSAEPELVA